MDYHIFNIGSPYINEWWSELRQRGVITAEFSGDPGDRGEVILRDMDRTRSITASMRVA